MKHYLMFAFSVLACVLTWSCTKDDGGEEVQNPLVGTMWKYSYTASLSGETIYDYIEFVDGATVTVWSTEWSGGSYSGSYSVAGNQVIFRNLIYKNLAGGKELLRATFTNNALTVYWKYDDSVNERKTVYTKS